MGSQRVGSNDYCFFHSKAKEVGCDCNRKNLRDLLVNSSDNHVDCKSDLEFLLLRSAYYDISQMNLHGFTICDTHYAYFMQKFRRDYCYLCKNIFGEIVASKRDLRRVSRAIAFGVWQDHHLSIFDQTACGACRKRLEKKYLNKELIDKSECIFSWLYDEFTIYTPSISSSPHSIYKLPEDIDIQLDQKYDLKHFLVNNGFQGRVQMTDSYDTMSKKTPYHHNQIWDEIVETEIEFRKQTFKIDGKFGIIMNCIADAYSNANHWSTRRQLLSVVAQDIPLYIIQEFIPDVTSWKLKIAKEQAVMNGRGAIVNIDRFIKIRYTEDQIAHFVQYILSPHITTDMPFGEKTIKLSSGDQIVVPNTIRNLLPTRIIQAYKEYCKECEEEFKPLSDSYLFAILQGCSASNRKSLQGLDYFACDGSNAFDILKNLCNELIAYNVTISNITSLNKALHEARNCLKNNYKLHVACDSEVADHCLKYGLSDPHNIHWQEDCGHSHNRDCDQCQLLINTLADLQATIENCNMSTTMKSRYLHRFHQNVQLIWDWKAHIMRTVQQDRARVDVLQTLENDSVLIILDWAMKWLPMKYREAQREFFDPTIKYAYIRADNAGCYHSVETLLSNKQIFEETGVFIRRFDFSDPQSGKSACDRMASVVKCNVRRHINEKNNVENSREFVDAAESTKYLSIYASKIISHMTTRKSVASTKRSAWQGVTMFNNLLFDFKSSKLKDISNEAQASSSTSDEIEVTAWRSYNIGSGKKFLWSNLNTVNSIDQLVVVYESSHARENWMDEKIIEDDANDDQSDNTDLDDEENEYAEEQEGDKNHDNFTSKDDHKLHLFDCPDPNCIRRFRRHANLQTHLATGNHKYAPNRLNLLDKAKLYYQEQLQNDKHEHLHSIQNFKLIYNLQHKNNSELKQGWALFNRKPQTPFSDIQTTYLTQKYEEGERNGLKWDPSQVSEQMQTASINGEYLFEPSQWLTTSQIKSFFSRLTRKRRQQSQTNKQNENEESSDDNEPLAHAELMNRSIEILQQNETDSPQQAQTPTNSPSTIREMNSRSNDDLSNLHRTILC